MDSLIQQVNTISGLVAEIADPTGKEEIMRKHALSVKAQLQNMTVTPEDSMSLMETVKQSSLGNAQKDVIITALSERLAKGLEGNPKQSRKSQTLDDIASFMTPSEVAFLQKSEYSLLARVHKLASVFARVFCWQPTEPCCGKAVNLLRDEFGLQELQTPQVFYNSVQDFKNHLRDLVKNKTAPATRITTYTNPDDLPQKLYQAAFAQEQPAGFQGGSSANMGPLRKSDRRLSGAAGPGVPANQLMQAFAMNPMQFSMTSLMSGLSNFGNAWQQNQMMQTPAQRPKRLALCDGSTSASNVEGMATNSPAATPAAAQQPAAEKPATAEQVAGTEKPLSPAEQAQAMLAAWQKSKNEKEDEASPHEEENDRDHATAFKKPAAGNGVLKNGRGRGRGRGRGNGRGRAQAMKVMNSMKKNEPKKKNGKAKGKGFKGGGKSGANKDKSKIKPAKSAKYGDLTPAMRLKLRPNGCGKCRYKPGCCPSCF